MFKLCILLAKQVDVQEKEKEKHDRPSFMERLNTVRNKQCEVNLQNIFHTFDSQRTRHMRRTQQSEDRLRYEHKVMSVDLKKNILEQQKRENPNLDTTFDEMVLKQATKYLTYNPDDCCYLNKNNRYTMVAYSCHLMVQNIMLLREDGQTLGILTPAK